MSVLIPSALRDNPVVVTGRSILELALAGRITVGLAYAGLVAGFVSVGGISVAALPLASAAVAVTRLERRGSRVWGVLCRGTGPVGSPPPEPQGSRTDRVALTGGTFATITVGSGQVRNPFGFAAQAVFSGSVRGILNVTNAAGVSVGRTPTEAFQEVQALRNLSFTVTAAAGETFGWSYQGAAGQTFTVRWEPPVQPAQIVDWRPAVSALVWAQSGLPWWGPIASGAQAGRWVRRSVWESGRQVRFEAGGGTTRAVAVVESGERVTTVDFGAAEFLAEDWEFADGLLQAPGPVDVTDLVFSGSSGAVAFAIEGSDIGADPSAGEPGTGVLPTAPASGDFVLVSKSGQQAWEAVRDI